MNRNKSTRSSDHHCTVLEQKNLVSQMTQCDSTSKNHEDKYKCYLKATKESRENKACMFA